MATEDCSLHPRMPPMGHVDDGSMANTTNQINYLFRCNEFVVDALLRAPQLRMADDKVHRPFGKGCLKVPTNNSAGFLQDEPYYTPQIPATILSPDAMAKSFHC